MKAYLQKLRLQHWDARPLQERKLIGVGALLILPLFGYLLLWLPAHEAVAKLHGSLPQLRIMAAQMHLAAAQVEEMRHRPELAVMDAAAVKNAVEESANTHQLRAALTTIVPQEPNAVRITLNAVSFEKWLAWLRELQESQHIRIDSASITPLSDPGMVAVQATLTNGNTP